MSSDSKLTAVSHPEPTRTQQFYRVAIVGAASLKGKEVAEVLSDRNFPSSDVRLLDDDEALGQLEAVGQEVTFIQKVRAEQFRNLDFTFFASDTDCTRSMWKTARDAGSAIIDLSYALEDEREAQVRSPWLERQLGRLPAPELQPGPAVAAHPAAVVLALLIHRISKAAEIRYAVATVFQPVSERGQKGMDELHEQTVNLLSFQQLPKNVFDAQIAFNMIPRYGDKAIPDLRSTQDRILKHYLRITDKSTVLPSLMVVQAPIFHGHAMSIHVQLSEPADIERISPLVAGEHVHLTGAAEEPPSNVTAAGQNEVQLSILPDSSQPNGLWLWAASDNLRVAAATAVECAETMAASRPRGKIQ